MDEFAPPIKKIKSEKMMENPTITEIGPSISKPVAGSLEEFLEQPSVFSPKPEYLINTFIEV